MRRRRVLLRTCALALPLTLTMCSSGLCDEPPLARPWQATGLGFTFLNSEVTTARCHQTETRFLSCVAAIQAMLDYHHQGLQLLHSSWTSPTDPASDLRQSFGSAQIRHEPGHDGHNLAELLRGIREKRSRILAWRELYRDGLPEWIDFNAIRTWTLSNVVDSDHREEYAATSVNGYLSAEDPHTRIAPAAFEEAKSRPYRYSGIGVSVQSVGLSALVTQVVRGSPADKAGIKPRDLVLSIDGEAAYGKTINEIVAMLRGPEQSGVTITVRRLDDELQLPVTRGEIVVTNVSSRVIEDRKQRWGYVKVESFSEATACQDVRKALQALQSSEVSGLILDLRNNMGGLVDQAVCVAELFLEPHRIVLAVRDVNAKHREAITRTRYPAFTELPMVTLVNASTASASELLAGALRDHHRSVLVGERTFGKGSIQLVEAWDASRHIAKYYTAALYFLPSGRTIQFAGIEPDFEISTHPLAELALREEDLFPMAVAVADTREVRPRAAIGAAIAQCLKTPGANGADPKGAIGDVDEILGQGVRALSCLKQARQARLASAVPTVPRLVLVPTRVRSPRAFAWLLTKRPHPAPWFRTPTP